MVLFIGLVAGGPLSAQQALYGSDGHDYRLVVRASGFEALAKVGDKEVRLQHGKYIFSKADEYLPVFVAVKDIQVRTEYLDVDGSDINNDFLFHATLNAPYSIKDVFIVLELNMERGGKMIYLQEVGNLTAYESQSVSVRVRMASPLGSGNYVLHLFSDGHELFQSEINPIAQDNAVDQMIERRLPKTPNAPPHLFIGPQPEYPRKLLKENISGQAMVKLRIRANGRVDDPVIESASNPAFAEAALTAVRLWRFIPQMKDGHPVKTTVEFPINFALPAPKKSS